MARSLLFVVLAAVAIASAARAAASRGPLLGGWSPIKDVSDPHVQELGAWAVARHVELANDGLRFLRVTGGEQQVVSGMNYRLVVDATTDDGSGNGGGSVSYVAVVYEQSWTNTRTLTSFEPAAN